MARTIKKNKEMKSTNVKEQIRQSKIERVLGEYHSTDSQLTATPALAATGQSTVTVS